MSHIGLRFEHEDEPPPESAGHARGGSRRAQRKRGRGLRSCLPLLVVLVMLAAGIWFGGTWAVNQVQEQFGAAPDYPGPGTGSVLFEVQPGDTSGAIGSALAEAGVVKSAGSFSDAAKADSASRGIQPGFYRMRKQMQAEAALAILVNPDNLIQTTVLVPEGARVRDIVKTIVKKTDISREALNRVLADPGQIGLPAAAGGNPEGYLYPATYVVGPHETARSLLRQMVTKAVQVERDLGLEARARKLGFTAEQVITIASMLEYEANQDADYPKVARVIYNRLAKPMRLQFDSTVSYVSGRAGDVWTTAAERSSDSAYNTYQHDGLPPGPIGSPGQQTIEAALSPAAGDWLYFVPDFSSGRTLFTDSYSQHLHNVEKAKQYCQTHDEC